MISNLELDLLVVTISEMLLHCDHLHANSEAATGYTIIKIMLKYLMLPQIDHLASFKTA